MSQEEKKWCLIKWASQESGRRDDGGGGQAQGRRPGQWQTVFCLRPTKVFAPRRQTDTWKTPAVYDSPGLECRMPTSRICEHLSSITWVNIVYKHSNKSENDRKREINEAVMNKLILLRFFRDFPLGKWFLSYYSNYYSPNGKVNHFTVSHWTIYVG